MDRFSSFKPHGVADDADAARYPATVIIHKEGQLASNEGRNATSAEAMTSTGHTVGVTFHLAHPPAVSHFRVHGAKLGQEDFIDAPRVISAERDLVLLRLSLAPGHRIPSSAHRWLDEYFVYKARRGRASLRLIPVPRTDHNQPHICILPCDDDDDDGGEFLLVAFFPTCMASMLDLCVFSSETGEWSGRRSLELETPPDMSSNHDWRRMPMYTDKMILLGGGEVGLVDLSRGIRVCNVLHADPAFRLIPLPQGYSGNSSRLDRDVAVRGDLIQFVEIDRRSMEQSRKKVVRTCYRRKSWEYWRKGHLVDVDDDDSISMARAGLPSSSSDAGARRYAFKDLVMAFPAMSIVPGHHVVYLTSKVMFGGKLAWMIGLHLAKKKMDIIGPYCATCFEWPDFLVCSFSKYLNATPNQVSV